MTCADGAVQREITPSAHTTARPMSPAPDAGLPPYHRDEEDVMDQRFSATLQRSPAPGGWTHLVWRESVRELGTRGRVAVAGTVDGDPS